MVILNEILLQFIMDMHIELLFSLEQTKIF